MGLTIKDLSSSIDEMRDEMKEQNKETQLSLKCLENIPSILAELRGLTVKITSLETVANNNVKSVADLSSRLNDREQHSRNSSIRIFNYKMSDAVSRDSILTAKSVYSEILAPLLEKAVADGIFSEVPSVFDMIEHAHCLPPSKNIDPGRPVPAKPIIVRFQSILIRQHVFKYKKAHLADSQVFIVEDLTGENFKRLKALKADPDVKSAWSMGGRIFYARNDAPDQKLKL